MNSKELRDGWYAFGKIQVLDGIETTDVLIDGRVYMRFMKGDEGSKRMAIVQLYESRKGTQEDIAKAFGVNVKSVYNYLNAYKGDGIKSLIGESSGPKDAWKITPEMRFKVLEVVFRNKDLTLEEIVKAVERQWNEKISINSIRKVLMENGLIKEEIRRYGIKRYHGELFNIDEMPLLYNVLKDKEISESNYEIKETLKEGEEVTRNELKDIKEKRKRHYSRAQRIYLDQIERSSAGINIERGGYSAYAGGMLFNPLVKRYGYLPTIERVIDIDTQEGYGLDELCLTLFFYDIFGFRSIENFKTAYREEFGVLIGKLRSPSIYTLRRFNGKVKDLGVGEKLMEEFAKEYLRRGLIKWGVLYIDEHFLPYYGILIATMGWFTVRNKGLKGGYNFLSVDGNYNPFIFLIRPASEDLVKKIPEIIRQAKEIAKEVGLDEKKLIVVFDREGFCAELFRMLSDEKSDVCARFITWAKYKDKWIHDFKEEEFNKNMTVKYKIQDSDEVKYFETERQMNKYGKIRTIVVMSGRKKQRTAIYTNDKESSTEEIIQIMCTRWGHECLNKALKIDHYIDYFPGKGLFESEELEEQPMVDNPEREELKKERASLTSQLNKMKVEIADKILNMKKRKIDLDEEIKKKEVNLMTDIAVKGSQITLLNQKIKELPEEIKFEEAHDGRKLYKIDYEKKRFLDCIKMFSYHMQNKMCQMLLNYYDKKKEIWPAMEMIINRGGNVRLEKGKLTVTLKRFSDPEIDYAARHLCEDLNGMNPVTLDRFQLPIHYEVA